MGWWTTIRQEKSPTFGKINGVPPIKRSLVFGNLTVSQFWLEKLLIIIDFAQLLGFTLAAGWETWPEQWKFDTEFTLWFNVDIPFLYYKKTLEKFDFRAYMIAFWIIITIVYIILFLWLKMKQKYLLKERTTTEKWMLLMGQSMFLPLAVNLIVPGSCQYETSEDIEIAECDELPFEEFIIHVGALTAAAVFLLLPIGYFYYHAFSYTIHGQKRSHERYVMVKEFEHILKLSDTWRGSKLFLISSFKRSKFRIYHRSNMLVLKLFLVMIHAALNRSPTAKFAVLLVFLFPFTIIYTIWMPYRCSTSSLLWLSSMWTTVTIIMLGLLKAIDFDSNILFDANLANLLLVVVVITMCIIVLQTFTTFVLKVKWPLTVSIMKDHTIGWEYMINDFKKGQQTVKMLHELNTFRFVRKDKVEAVLSALKRHYEYARLKQHFLEDSLLGLIDELSALYNRIKEVSLLPNDNLEKHYHDFLAVCKRRHKEQLLMNPVKRRILLKLNAVRFFINNRPLREYNDIEEMATLHPHEKKDDDFAMIEEIELQGFFKQKQGMLTANNILRLDGGFSVDSLDPSPRGDSSRDMINTRINGGDNRQATYEMGDEDDDGKPLVRKTDAVGFYQIDENEGSKSLLRKLESSVSNIDDFIEMTSMILNRHELTPVEPRVLRRVQMYWNKFIKDWEKSFFREFHRLPNDDDREVRIGSYLYWQKKVDESCQVKL